ncbi:hypothetical protein QYE76_024165 [Lolium multiflorum]|uniref:Retrotransposon gag domain-containing protein n=1 Tax=Lolium multiflorum TaxID=4521 RepID=A0AAD8VVS3_LOLMU|nr:hypothetical protein QYE76_024165 [Lolium multiflorum]
MDVEDWLMDTERKLKTVGCNDEEKIRYTTYLLSGPAAWWENLVAVHPPDKVFTWEEFKKKFRDAHVPDSVVELKKREFDELRQNTAPIMQYVRDFNRLSRYAPEDVDTEEKRKKRFMKGMNPYMKMQLRLENIAYDHVPVNDSFPNEQLAVIKVSSRESPCTMVSNNKDKEPLKENIQDPELKKEDAREDEEEVEEAQERQQATVASIGVISREKEPEAEEWGNNSKSWDSPSDRLLNRVEHNSEMIRNLIYRIDELQELIEKLVRNSSPPSPKE